MEKNNIVGKALSLGLIIGMLGIFLVAPDKDTSKSDYETLLGQVSYLSEEYLGTSEDYQTAVIGQAALQVKYNEVLEENIELTLENFKYSEQLDDLFYRNSFLMRERDALMEANYNFDFSIQERLLLSQIVYAEAQFEELEGQLGVIQVIINRVNSSQFPDTIEEVIKQEGQFSGYSHERWGGTTGRTDYAVYAYADLDLRANKIDESILYFYSAPTTAFLRSLTVQVKIGNHYFCAD